jgi:glycosyltransferase involved in cell wall biosynthesis
MQLLMTLLVRDEADIIEDNIKFHLAQGVDHIIVTDNNSKDGTKEILEKYEKDGILTLLHEASTDYKQSEWVNRMISISKIKFNPKWIINNDADEFWYSPSNNLKNHLIDENVLLQCDRVNMVSSTKIIQENSLKYYDNLIWKSTLNTLTPMLNDIYEDKLSMPYFYYKLPFILNVKNDPIIINNSHKLLTPTKNLLNVGNGMHTASYSNNIKLEKCDIKIYHFPIRNIKSFEDRINQIGEVLYKRPKPWNNESWKYRRWKKMLENEGILAPLKDALPTHTQFRIHINTGILIKDNTIQNILNEL